MYLRLSREDEDRDGISKAESNSISSQRELIRTYIRESENMELYDSYVDDGFSGSNFDRPELKRMMEDIEAGNVNCVIVKDLSRFGRDYIETGRYLERIFPSMGVRFIALTDHYDSMLSDPGEQTILLPVKNFINDSYCRDISTKVKSQLAAKRKAGEYLGAFPVYGYQKDPKNKNHLIPDHYAADIVRRIFTWKIDGMAMSAIARKLNELGILSPREYKKSLGENFQGGFSGTAQSKWSSVAVRRILTDETYLGHLLQGKTEKINYKVKKSLEKPKKEWIRTENTHTPIITQDDFSIVQNLLLADGRVSPTGKQVNPFMGLLFCGDCGEQMVRRTVRYKDTCKLYYICSTKNRGEGCSRHSIQEDVLKDLVKAAVYKYANSFLDQKRLFEQANGKEADISTIAQYNKEIIRLKTEQDNYYSLCSGLHEDLRQGIVTKDEFDRLYQEFAGKAKEAALAQEKQQKLIQEMFRSGILSASRLQAFQNSLELQELDRHTLASLVKRIYLYEGKKIEIQFYFLDQFLVMEDFNQNPENPPQERRA
ncbi:MAG: recombinase family protein [Lachnospiraceae bacterium]|nr:recombinase family protein [Lachnospiraceae bacterium]